MRPLTFYFGQPVSSPDGEAAAPSPAPAMAKPAMLSSPMRGPSAWASSRSDESVAPSSSRRVLSEAWIGSGDSEAADPMRADHAHNADADADADVDHHSVVSFRPLDYRPSSQPVSLPATQDLLTSPTTPRLGHGTSSSSSGDGSSFGGPVPVVLVPPSPGLALHRAAADGGHNDVVAPMELDVAPLAAVAAPTAGGQDDDDDDDEEAAAMRRRMRAAAALATPPAAAATGGHDDVADELPDDLPEIAGLRSLRATPAAGPTTTSTDAADLPAPPSPRSPPSADEEEEPENPGESASAEAPATADGSTGGSSEGRRRFPPRHVRQTARFSPSRYRQSRRAADAPLSDNVQRYLQMMRRQSQLRVRTADELRSLTEGDLDDSDDEVADQDDAAAAAAAAAAALDTPGLTAQHHRALQAMGASERRVRDSIVRLRGGTEFFEYTAYLSTLPVSGAAPHAPPPVAAPAFVAGGLFAPLQPTLQRIAVDAAVRRAALAGGFLEHAVRNRLQWLWDATAAHGAPDVARAVTEPAYTAAAELRALCTWLVALCTPATEPRGNSDGHPH